MIAEKNLLIPDWPDALSEVDIVKARFALDLFPHAQSDPMILSGLGVFCGLPAGSHWILLMNWQSGNGKRYSSLRQVLIQLPGANSRSRHRH